jgi:hypothetical protein
LGILMISLIGMEIVYIQKARENSNQYEDVQSSWAISIGCLYLTAKCEVFLPEKCRNLSRVCADLSTLDVIVCFTGEDCDKYDDTIQTLWIVLIVLSAILGMTMIGYVIAKLKYGIVENFREPAEIGPRNFRSENTQSNFDEAKIVVQT